MHPKRLRKKIWQPKKTCYNSQVVYKIRTALWPDKKGEYMSKDMNENWKSDEQRAERKERLQAQKTADGGKKKIRKTFNLRNFLIIVIIIAAILGLCVMGLINSGYKEKHQVAALVNGKYEVTPLEMNYTLGSSFNQMFRTSAFHVDGKSMLVNPQLDPEAQSLRPLRDILIDNFGKSASQTYAVYDQAIQAGYEIGEKEHEAFNRFKQNIEMSAAQQQMNPNHLLSLLFGRGANFKSLQPILERHFLAARYQLDTQNAYEFTDAEYDAEYEAHPELYDYVSFHAFGFNNATPDRDDSLDEDKDQPESDQAEEETAEEEKAEKDKAGQAADLEDEDAETKETEAEESEAERNARLNAEALTKAQAMADASTSFEKFRHEAMAYTLAEDRHLLEDEDATLVKRAKYTDLSPSFSAWLFDAARKEGDTTVISDNGRHSVLYFVSRDRDEARTYSSRHILIRDKSLEEGAEAEAKAAAEKILDEYNAGDKTEEAFAALATQYSQDPGSKDQGGLYEDTQPGRFVKAYEEWCLDPARQEGDVGMVRVEGEESGGYSGYHIIYFKGLGESVWKTQAKQAMARQKFADALKAQEDSYSFEPREDSMNLVLPIDQAALESVRESIQDLAKSVQEEPSEKPGDAETAPGEAEAASTTAAEAPQEEETSAQK